MIARFPAYRLQIIQLFTHNANFKSLCEDYSICRQSIDRYTISQEQQTEFKQLCLELENEALNHLTHTSN